MKMRGDRQDLRLNMTGMAAEDLERSVLDGLKRCNAALEVGLSEKNLIKTTHYRAGKKAKSLL